MWRHRARLSGEMETMIECLQVSLSRRLHRWWILKLPVEVLINDHCEHEGRSPPLLTSKSPNMFSHRSQFMRYIILLSIKSWKLGREMPHLMIILILFYLFYPSLWGRSGWCENLQIISFCLLRCCRDVYPVMSIAWISLVVSGYCGL